MKQGKSNGKKGKYSGKTSEAKRTQKEATAGFVKTHKAGSNTKQLNANQSSKLVSMYRVQAATRMENFTKSLNWKSFATLYQFCYIVPVLLHCTTFATLYHQ